MPKGRISHSSLEVMSFKKSISLCYIIRINEFHCLAKYNCSSVLSWYSVDSNLLANESTWSYLPGEREELRDL